MDMPPAAHPPAARDHLANERTYLAWMRTGIALTGLGIVIAKLGIDLRPLGRISPRGLLRSGSIAFLFAIAGLLTVGFATWRFFRTERMIQEGEFEPLGYRVLMISGGFLVIGAATLIYLWGKVYGVPGP